MPKYNYGEDVFGWISVDLETWNESPGTDPLEAVDQSLCCFDSKEKAAENAAAYFKLSKEAELFLAEEGGIHLCETREGTKVLLRSITLTKQIMAKGTAK